jgi:hypothetical protein
MPTFRRNIFSPSSGLRMASADESARLKTKKKSIITLTAVKTPDLLKWVVSHTFI